MKKQKVVEHFGNQTNVAKVLGIKSPSVCEWGDIIPEKQAMRLERITDGALVYDPSLYQQQDAA